MKTNIIFFITLLGSILGQKATFSSYMSKGQESSKQEVGVPIRQSDFDNLVIKFSTIMQSGDSIKSINDYIELARVFNTIAYTELFNVKKYKKLVSLYSGRYSIATIKALEAVITKGSYFYSKKYNITIGGPDTNNNRFKIIR